MITKLEELEELQNKLEQADITAVLLPPKNALNEGRALRMEEFEFYFANTKYRFLLNPEEVYEVYQNCLNWHTYHELLTIWKYDMVCEFHNDCLKQMEQHRKKVAE